MTQTLPTSEPKFNASAIVKILDSDNARTLGLAGLRGTVVRKFFDSIRCAWRYQVQLHKTYFADASFTIFTLNGDDMAKA